MLSKGQQIEKRMTAFSERVKMVDIHPKEPFAICSLYNGRVTIWNIETKQLLKTFEVIDVPVRCVKFIVKLQSFACGADDLNIRVYNYNTMEKTKTFSAHDDYIRSIAVHDQLPLILTSSDDMRIKAWDWSKNWTCTMVFEGHEHYVMHVVFNPKDSNFFASASLDHTVKVWNIHNHEPFFTLVGHEDGVNCVEYYPHGDKPYLISGADDNMVKVWDYQTRACVQTLTQHGQNITAVMFHPEVPLAFTGSEDESVAVINTQTWRQETSLNYGLGRVWSIAARSGTNVVVIGYDRGFAVLKVGSDEPVFAMDETGKLYQAHGSELTRTDIKNLPADLSDGEVLRSLATKDLGSCESNASELIVAPSGQCVSVISETGEFTVYSALAWRPKAFGQCISFAWGPENGCYATLENGLTLNTYKSFKPAAALKLSESATKLFPGPLLGICGQHAITFIDWETSLVVRRIEGAARMVRWSDSGELLALVLDCEFYVLKYDHEAVLRKAVSVRGEKAATSAMGPDGVEEAFAVVEEMEEKVLQATWVGDCFCFINNNERLNYYIGGEVTNIAMISRDTYLLGYLAKENRLVCLDKKKNIITFYLHVSVIEYKSAIVRGDFETAERLLAKISTNFRVKIVQFLQAKGLLALALDVATEDDQRFDLAIQLGNVDVAVEVVKRLESPMRWRQVTELALENGMFDIAEHAMKECKDYNGLLLLYNCAGNTKGIADLGATSLADGKTHVAFACYHLLGDYAACTDVLLHSAGGARVADAAFYARTYCHHKIDEVVKKWRESLADLPSVRDSIADVTNFPNLFPGVDVNSMGQKYVFDANGDGEGRDGEFKGLAGHIEGRANYDDGHGVSVFKEVNSTAAAAAGHLDSVGQLVQKQQMNQQKSGIMSRPSFVGQSPDEINGVLSTNSNTFDDMLLYGSPREPPATPVNDFFEQGIGLSAEADNFSGGAFVREGVKAVEDGVKGSVSPFESRGPLGSAEHSQAHPSTRYDIFKVGATPHSIATVKNGNRAGGIASAPGKDFRLPPRDDSPNNELNDGSLVTPPGTPAVFEEAQAMFADHARASSLHVSKAVEEVAQVHIKAETMSASVPSGVNAPPLQLNQEVAGNRQVFDDLFGSGEGVAKGREVEDSLLDDDDDWN